MFDKMNREIKRMHSGDCEESISREEDSKKCGFIELYFGFS